MTKKCRISQKRPSCSKSTIQKTIEAVLEYSGPAMECLAEVTMELEVLRSSKNPLTCKLDLNATISWRNLASLKSNLRTT